MSECRVSWACWWVRTQGGEMASSSARDTDPGCTWAWEVRAGGWHPCHGLLNVGMHTLPLGETGSGACGICVTALNCLKQ